MDTTEESREEAIGMGDTNHGHEEDGGGGNGGNRQNSRKLIFRCSKPSATFEVCDTDKLNYYTILDDFKPIFEVKNTSFEEDGTTKILECVNYDFTLKDWLDKNDSLCPIYLHWNINRPSHEARKIIVGILESLEDLLSGNHSHGALSYTENYAIKLLHERVEEKEKVKVTFIGVNMKGRWLETGLNVDRQRDDVAAVSHIIFNTILKKRAGTRFPKDLLDLQKLLSHGEFSGKRKNMKVIASHSSLWHYRDRISYFDRLMKLNKQGNNNERNKIRKTFEHLQYRYPKYRTWRTQRLPKPLDSVRGYNNYSEKLIEIGRYFRITFEHISDEFPSRHFDHVLESEWKDMQYVEHMLTENFPELLLELHKNLIDIIA